MTKRLDILERQLQKAQKVLDSYVSKLKNEKKLADDQFQKDPRWRQLKATVLQLGRQKKSFEKRRSTAPASAE